MRKWEADNKSDVPIKAIQAVLVTEDSLWQESIRCYNDFEKQIEKKGWKNRCTIKLSLQFAALIFQHISPSLQIWNTIIVSYEAKDLENFFGGAGKNALYTSCGAKVEFIEAISIWVEEILLEWLQSKSWYSIMTGECKDVSTLEELSLFCNVGKKIAYQKNIL